MKGTTSSGAPVALAVNRNLGVVIGATETGEVAAFSLLTGKKMWSAAAPGGILGMQVGPSQVVVVCQDKHVYAWSCRSGAAQWLARLDSVPTGPPLSDGNTLLVTTQDGLRYLQLQSGQELKERRLALPTARHPAVLGNWLLLGTGDFLEALAP